MSNQAITVSLFLFASAALSYLAHITEKTHPIETQPRHTWTTVWNGKVFSQPLSNAYSALFYSNAWLQTMSTVTSEMYKRTHQFIARQTDFSKNASGELDSTMNSIPYSPNASVQSPLPQTTPMTRVIGVKSPTSQNDNCSHGTHTASYNNTHGRTSFTSPRPLNYTNSHQQHAYNRQQFPPTAKHLDTNANHSIAASPTYSPHDVMVPLRITNDIDNISLQGTGKNQFNNNDSGDYFSEMVSFYGDFGQHQTTPQHQQPIPSINPLQPNRPRPQRFVNPPNPPQTNVTTPVKQHVSGSLSTSGVEGAYQRRRSNSVSVSPGVPLLQRNTAMESNELSAVQSITNAHPGRNNTAAQNQNQDLNDNLQITRAQTGVAGNTHHGNNIVTVGEANHSGNSGQNSPYNLNTNHEKKMINNKIPNNNGNTGNYMTALSQLQATNPNNPHNNHPTPGPNTNGRKNVTANLISAYQYQPSSAGDNNSLYSYLEIQTTMSSRQELTNHNPQAHITQNYNTTTTRHMNGSITPRYVPMHPGIDNNEYLSHNVPNINNNSKQQQHAQSTMIKPNSASSNASPLANINTTHAQPQSIAKKSPQPSNIYPPHVPSSMYPSQQQPSAAIDYYSIAPIPANPSSVTAPLSTKLSHATTLHHASSANTSAGLSTPKFHGLNNPSGLYGDNVVNTPDSHISRTSRAYSHVSNTNQGPNRRMMTATERLNSIGSLQLD